MWNHGCSLIILVFFFCWLHEIKMGKHITTQNNETENIQGSSNSQKTLVN